jgi:hypothetical protein
MHAGFQGVLELKGRGRAYTAAPPCHVVDKRLHVLFLLLPAGSDPGRAGANRA